MGDFGGADFALVHKPRIRRGDVHRDVFRDFGVAVHDRERNNFTAHVLVGAKVLLIGLGKHLNVAERQILADAGNGFE